MHLRSSLLLVTLTIMALTLSATAEYTAPSADQVATVVDKPANTAVLLAGASPQEAAHAVRAILLAIRSAPLSQSARSARMSTVLQEAMRAMGPAHVLLFAEALGNAIGASVVFTSDPAIASLVQDVIASTAGGAAASAFGGAYTTATQTSGRSGNATEQVQPPAPALGYEVQTY